MSFAIASQVQLGSEHMRKCFANAATGIVVTDFSGVFLAVNPAFAKISGYSVEELLGTNIRELMFDQDSVSADDDYFRLAKREIESCVCEHRIRRKDGKVVWLRVSVSMLPREPGIAAQMIAIAEDISTQKKLEEQIRQSNKMEALGRFAGGIAHDFNNLLMIINNYAALLTEEFGPDSPMGSKAAAIQEAGTRGSALTRHLLAFSRKQILKTQVASIDGLIQTSEQLLRRLIREDIEVSIWLDSGGGRIDIDPGQFERVLMNLVGNASDAMPSGGRLTITTSRTLIEEDPTHPDDPNPGSYVVLSVADTGIGMDAATLDRIFEPFFTSKKGAGTGLGLSTVYGIVEQSGGRINVESCPGSGTTFHVYLPMVDQGCVSEPARPAAVSDRARQPIRATVLLVEDEALLRRCLTNSLSAMGCYVLQAKDGEQALEMAKRQLLLVDLVITDMIMPRLGGLELVRSLRTMRPKLPVIFMSGYTDSSPTRDDLRLGYTQFIQKPFNPDLLRDEVEGMLRLRNCRRA